MFDVQVCSGNGTDTIWLASVGIGGEKEIATDVMIEEVRKREGESVYEMGSRFDIGMRGSNEVEW